MVQARGTIEVRRAGTENPKLATGEIELRADAVEVLSTARTPAFPINEPAAEAGRAGAAQDRYLDLRRAPMLERCSSGHGSCRRSATSTRRHGFVEIETPMLIKSTPEGARDFIVPSRLQPGSIYALPQARSSSSSCSWSAASTATSRSHTASATRTCAPIAGPSSRSSTSR